MMMASSLVSLKRVVTCFILTSSAPATSLTGEVGTICEDDATRRRLARETLRVAVFQRRTTMPTFASHWAGISGSIEEGEEPWQTARRELAEETNLVDLLSEREAEAEASNSRRSCRSSVLDKCLSAGRGGLYLDVPFRPPNRFIRVYPFVVPLLDRSDMDEESLASSLELRGTEHSTFRFVSIPQLEQLGPAVPGLATSFHHATFGQYLAQEALPDEIWEWASDKVNGAATLAKRAVVLAAEHSTTAINNDPSSNVVAATMAMLRPTMVPITNALTAFEEHRRNLEHCLTHEDTNAATVSFDLAKGSVQAARDHILQSLEDEVDHALQRAVAIVLQCMKDNHTPGTPYRVATFSRSSTLRRLLRKVLLELDSVGDTPSLHVICARSTPGNEGELMALDLEEDFHTDDEGNDSDNDNAAVVECLDDDVVHDRIRQGFMDIVVVGSDCIMIDLVLNKVGTKFLAQRCSESNTCIVCCGDRWKQWDDCFLPPLEEELFESVPRSLFDHVVFGEEPLSATPRQ